MPSALKASHDPYAAFRYSNYRYYAFGAFFSVMGQQMLRVAVGYEIYQRTHSALALGLIGFFIWLPILLFMLPGGAVADRFNRKGIVLVCGLIYGLCAVGLGLAPRFSVPLPLMYTLLFLTGLNRAFNDPARQSLLPQLVPRKYFTNAITWNSNFFQVGSVTGPALGGMLYAAIGYSNVCFTEAFLEIIFLASIWGVRQSPIPYKREPIGLDSLGMGLKFVWRAKLILATITMDLFAVLFGGATALLPAYSVEILKCGSIGMGWLQAAPPFGAFLTAIWMAHHPPMKKAGPVLLGAVSGFGVAIIIFGLSKWFWLSFLALLAAGAFDLISVIVRHTLVQVLTPDSMRGRVTAVSYIFIHSSNELGGFESGAVAALLGLMPSVVLGGVGSILVVLGVMRIWPEVARLKSLGEMKSAV